MKYKKIYIELTNICGLQCTFCPPSKSKPSTMSLGMFEKLLHEVKTLTRLITFHVGGDPLVLSDLTDYLDIAHAYGLKVELSTSGFYTANHSQETLLHPAIRQLNFSLNSYNKNLKDDTLDNYLRPVFELCGAKFEKNNAMFINLRLWNDEVSDEVFNALILSRVADYFDVPLDVKSRERMRAAPRIIVAFDDYFEWPSLDGGHSGDGFCHGLDSHFAVLSDGGVVPCCLDKDGVVVLGNIHETSLDVILRSERSRNIKEGFVQGIAVEGLCQKCGYKNRFREL